MSRLYMRKILHLERKFISPTETFIYNQIQNLNNLSVLVATVKEVKGIENDFTILKPKKSQWVNSNILFPPVTNDLVRQLNNYNITLIHTHYLTDASFFYPLTKEMKCPKICSVYGYDVSEFPQKYRGLGKLYLQRVFRSYDKIIAMSPDMEKDLLKIGCPADKIIVHYYGTDISRYTPIQRSYDLRNGVLRLLTVASLRDKKGHITVLKALALIKEKVRFFYDIVGEGPLRSELEQLAQNLGLGSQVRFHGHVEYKDNVLLYSDADVFILTSEIAKSGDKEGIPGVIVEGMASALPIISTYHAGIPFIIENGFSGLLAEEKDSPKIAEYILMLYQDEGLRKSIGSKAREATLKNLNLQIRTKELVKIYNQLL